MRLPGQLCGSGPHPGHPVLQLPPADHLSTRWLRLRPGGPTTIFVGSLSDSQVGVSLLLVIMGYICLLLFLIMTEQVTR